MGGEGLSSEALPIVRLTVRNHLAADTRDPRNIVGDGVEAGAQDPICIEFCGSICQNVPVAKSSAYSQTSKSSAISTIIRVHRQYRQEQVSVHRLTFHSKIGFYQAVRYWHLIDW